MQDAVHRGEGDLFAALLEDGEELLGADEVLALVQHGFGPGSDQPTLLPETELQALTRGIRAFPTKKRRGRAAAGKTAAKDSDLVLGGLPR